jgi:hypothetical protein
MHGRRVKWVSDEDNALLVKPFSDEEIDFAIKNMKTNMAPGPNGFPVAFVKEFLDEVKPLIKEMLCELVNGQPASKNPGG